MNIHLKPVLASVVAALLTLAFNTGASADTKILKINHQFPGGTEDEGDFRDRLVRKFAAEVERRTDGELKFEIYPSSSLVKTMSQFPALQSGELDMSVLPLSYAGSIVPEASLGLMPALVTSYEQGLRWKNAPIGKEWTKLLEGKGIKIITWVWQAGGTASRMKPLILPADVAGSKIRGGSKEMDLMLKAAGGTITNVPSNEIYHAIQSGVLDAAVTSSTSLISFRLYEQVKHVTSAQGKTFWFMFEPLLMSKATFDKLTSEQRKIVTDVGSGLEKFGMEASKADDQRLAEIYAKAGAKVHKMDDSAFQQWRTVAQESAWRAFEEKIPDGKRWLEMAIAVK